MSIHNTSQRYGSVAKLLHWVVAVCVISMLAFGFLLDYLPKAYKPTAYMLHKSTGLLILALMVIRLGWTVSQVKPRLPLTVNKIQAMVARLVQYSFYLLLIVMPLSGWIMSLASGRIPSFYGLFNASLPFIDKSKALAQWMVSVHEYVAFTLIFLVSLHILAALKHHFIDKDTVLSSML